MQKISLCAVYYERFLIPLGNVIKIKEIYHPLGIAYETKAISIL